MMTSTRFSHSRLLFPLAGIWVIILMASCGVVPKNYPSRQPFVFKYNVDVEGIDDPNKKTDLVTRLENQLDDSIRVRTVRKLFYKGFNRPVLENPPIYDSNNADRSVVYMRGLLNAMGYFRDSITYKTSVDTVSDDQYRTTVDFKVLPGVVVKIDSFAYNIDQPELQGIAIASQKDALIKQGDPFAKAPISVELDRLTELYRNNGFLLFGREMLVGLFDTLGLSLLKPTFDPTEQLEILRQLQNRRDTPTADLEIRLKPGYDSSKLTKYYVGNIDLYPDYGLDSAQTQTIHNGIRIHYNQNLFKPRVLTQFVYFRRGDLYDQRNYYKTVNKFSSLGAWRLANIEYTPRPGQDTADFRIYLTTAKKYSFIATVEASRNQSAISGNLFGIGLNTAVQNRNLGRAANQSTTNIRYGIETGKDTGTNLGFIQTHQVSLSYIVYFPRPIDGGVLIPKRWREDTRTVLTFNAAITRRKELYDLNTVNGAWGYEITGPKQIWNIRVPNLEYSSFYPQVKLLEIFNNNPSLRNIFTDGMIISALGSVALNGGRKQNINVFKANIELAGIASGLIRTKFLDTNLYRFIKMDADFARKLPFGKTALILRAFAGVGYELDSTRHPQKRNNLPFFRQYYSGGPNSMRAWGLRKLGPGSVIKNFNTTGQPDRYGDIQLEANVEFRFPLLDYPSFKVSSAVFTDIGNVWFLKGVAGLPEEVFNFSRLATDLGVGVGAGLRFDFNYFVVRLEYAYKAKDPSPSISNASHQNKWFSYTLNQGQQFQLGINYPFVQ